MNSKTVENDIFKWLVNEYYNRVLNSANYYLRNISDAEDITQEVFIKAFEKIDFSKIENSKFPILFVITKNLCFNLLKKRGYKEESLPEYELKSDNINPEDSYIESESKSEIKRALSQLKDKEREIIVLKHFQECSYSEISEILDIPIGTVMSRLYSARKKMAKIIKNGGSYEE